MYERLRSCLYQFCRGVTMFEKEAEEILNNHCDCELLSECMTGIRCRCSDFEESKKLLIEGIEFGYNKINKEFKICEQNADTYYDQLQKAKQIIQEFLYLNYSEFTKTNAVFLHADKFLKESK